MPLEGFGVFQVPEADICEQAVSRKHGVPLRKERMEENLDIWDFTLSDEDMAAINALDIGHSEIIDHSSAETAKWLNSWKIHD